MKFINIILDSRRVERYDLLIAELKRQGLTEADYEIWPCLLLNTVVESISASHKMIVRKAKEEGMEEICVMEDDVCLPAADGWKYFLKKKPKYYSLYLAGCYSSVGSFFDMVIMEHENITRNPIGFHMYMIHESYYDTLLATDDKKHIDTAQEGIFHVCYPMAAIQRAGFSANNLAWADYNVNLKDEDVYGGLPQ